MLIGVYADPHITKNMRTMQSTWDVTSMKSIRFMYDKFDELCVESVVCLGDFFDAPRIEAKSMQLVLPILEYINSRSYPTYILLGNHEAESSDNNILDFLGSYNNIIPMTTLAEIEGMVFVPYYEDLTELGDTIKDKIVFTHHDIYGSMLAAGRTRAFFGTAPDVLKSAKLVLNGHVHTKSQPAPNIMNVGSLLVSQQGELRVGEYPSYYTLDTNTAMLQSYNNEYSMIYLTVDVGESKKLVNYDSAHLVLRVEYEGEIPENYITTAHTSWKKKIISIDSPEIEASVNRNFDLKNYLVDYIQRDSTVSDLDKTDYITTGMEMLA